MSAASRRAPFEALLWAPGAGKWRVVVDAELNATLRQAQQNVINMQRFADPLPSDPSVLVGASPLVVAHQDSRMRIYADPDVPNATLLWVELLRSRGRYMTAVVPPTINATSALSVLGPESPALGPAMRLARTIGRLAPQTAVRTRRLAANESCQLAIVHDGQVPHGNWSCPASAATRAIELAQLVPVGAYATYNEQSRSSHIVTYLWTPATSVQVFEDGRGELWLSFVHNDDVRPPRMQRVLMLDPEGAPLPIERLPRQHRPIG